MEEQLRMRLAQLDEEFEKGQEMLREAELQQRQLTETLLRISGARQVLLELLGEEEQAPPGGVSPNGGQRGRAAADA